MNYKKSKLLPILAALLLAWTATFTASAGSTTTIVTKITFEEAIAVAKDAHPGFTMLALSLEDEDGAMLYKAVMLNPADNTLAEVSIDPASGQIKIETSSEDQQNETDDAQDSAMDDDEQEVGAKIQENEEDDGDEDFLSDESLLAVQISFEQALTAVKIAYPEMTITKLGLEDENGVLVFKAELNNPADGSEVEVAIDSKTGQVVPQDENVEYQDENESENSN